MTGCAGVWVGVGLDCFPLKKRKGLVASRSRWWNPRFGRKKGAWGDGWLEGMVGALAVAGGMETTDIDLDRLSCVEGLTQPLQKTRIL